jgi:hypothetical protein
MAERPRQDLALACQVAIGRRVKVADLTDNTDEGRLRLLEPKEAARLRLKYEQAIAILGATQEFANAKENRTHKLDD